MLILIRNSALCLLLSLVMAGCGNQEQIITPTIPIEKFRSADLAFRLGRSIESDVIAARGEGGYSHIGVIVSSDSGLRVVHIEPSRSQAEIIRSETLEEFFHPDRALAGAVMRFDGIDSLQRGVVERRATNLLAAKISFDHDYILSDSNAMYCTELAEWIFQQIGISLYEDRRQDLPFAREAVILPSDIYVNENLESIWHYSAPPRR